MTPAQIQQLQTSLGIPATGVWDTATGAAYSSAVSKAVAANPDIAAYGGSNTSDAILNAYETGDWSGVTDLTGKPFTDDQQKAAVAQANTALAPAYDAQVAKDTADTTATLQKNQESLADTEGANATQFGADKNVLDQNAANSGVLFTGSRLQKQQQLADKYSTADAIARRNAGESAASTAGNYAYAYGSDAARPLSSLYSVPGATNYNAGVAGGKVTPSATLSSAYAPPATPYQGTAPVAQSAAVQQRAAGLLANNANKLTLSGVGTKF